MQLGTITPDQIRATADKHVCGYFSVTDVNGDKTHVQIGNKKDLDQKIDETLKSIASLPDQVFKITFRKSMTGKNPALYSYYLSKTPNTQPNLREPAPQTIINTPFEPARSMGEALKDARELAETKAECKRLQDEIDRLKMQIMQSESLSEEEEEEDLKENNVTQLAGFAKEVLPQFIPMVDKYFEIQQQKLALQAMALNRPQNIQSRRKAAHPFRPFWSSEDTAKTEQYFNWLDKQPDNIFIKELQDMQNNAPGLYMAALQEFNLNQENEQENNPE